jgi:polysaccharide export outer membrane protein
MVTKQRSYKHSGVVLGVSLALCIITAQGAVSAISAVTLEGAMAGWLAQRGSEASDQQSTPAAKHVTDDYIIGPSDVLAIDVWKDTELTRIITVRPDGKISLPLVGELEVSGLTANKVQKLIVQRLAEYISNPQVTVIVQEVKSQSYVIVGKVSKPGSYELGKPTTVLEAIAIAGGFLDFAKVNKVRIIRPRAGGQPETLYFDYKQVIKGKKSEQNVALKNGDTIVVP